MTINAVGTPGHAEEITRGRHPGVSTALAWLAFSHLPPALQSYSRPFYQTAVELIHYVRTDSAELTTALDKLVEAKDWAVRAGIRADQGRPGPVPRPAEVTDPPVFASQTFLPAPRPAGSEDVRDLRSWNTPRPIRDSPQA